MRREELIDLLRDLRSKEFELAEYRRAIHESLARLNIKAPVAGIVLGMQIHSLGSVISPAEPIMQIVPQDRPLVIVTRVLPTDIDQLYIGQDVSLSFSALDRNKVPELLGRVDQVSADVLYDQTTSMPFYRVEILLKEGELEKMPKDIALLPGMPVECFIQTNEITVLGYLLKPLMNYFNKAFRES